MGYHTRHVSASKELLLAAFALFVAGSWSMCARAADSNDVAAPDAAAQAGNTPPIAQADGSIPQWDRAETDSAVALEAGWSLTEADLMVLRAAESSAPVTRRPVALSVRERVMRWLRRGARADEASRGDDLGVSLGYDAAGDAVTVEYRVGF